MNISQEALATLEQLEAVRRRTLQPFHALWYPVLVYGVLCLASAPLYELAPSATAIYWIVAALAGWIAVSRYYGGRARRVGVGRPAHLTRATLEWIAVYFAVFAVCIIGAALDSRSTIVVGITAVIGTTYVLLARQAHNAVVAVAGVAIAASGIAVAASGASHAMTITMLAMGSILSLTGLYLHAQQSDA